MIAAAVAANLAQALLFVTGLGCLFLSFRGFLKGARPAPADNSGGGGFRRFAVLLPAYNEEKVIRFALESFKRMDYPPDRFDVFLAADHCTDGTAGIAARLGVVVLDHSGPDMRPGKGRALKWAVGRILAMDGASASGSGSAGDGPGETPGAAAKGGYDAICYFDADSLAHPRFLKVMNAHLAAGETVVQGRQLAKNAGCWLARILAGGHLVTNRFFQRPKYALGFSATLHGKGMCFSREAAALYQWDETCLTEDLEMQMRLIRSGVRITWAEDAIVYDEEPESLGAYLTRNIRWTRGSLDTARRHLRGLVHRAFADRDLKALEGAVYCAQTYRLGAAVVTAALIWCTRDSFNLFIWLYRLLPGAEPVMKAAGVFPLAVYPSTALLLEKASPEIFAAYFLQPALGFFRLPVFVAGVFRDCRDWGRTDHVSQVAISDLV
ncbi:MAG: glycosyltransferase family 2 protein [Elusimicrobiales bacterium]